MRGQQAAGVSALVIAGLVLTGCGASAEPAATPPAEMTQADAAENDVALDVAACEAISDVLTIVENADIALREGRMAAQEQQGWYKIAVRTLDRIPSTGDGAISQGVADMKEAGPAVDAWMSPEPVVIDLRPWLGVFIDLEEPCLAVDVQLAVSMFTGG